MNAVSSRFKELLDFGFNQLNSNDIKPRIKQACDTYATINHKINEVFKFLKFKFINFIYILYIKDEYNQYSTSDPFIQNFVKQIDQMLALLKVNIINLSKYIIISNFELK